MCEYFPQNSSWVTREGPLTSIPDALQQKALTCINEAVQICPDVFTTEDHGLACMTGKLHRVRTFNHSTD